MSIEHAHNDSTDSSVGTERATNSANEEVLDRLERIEAQVTNEKDDGHIQEKTPEWIFEQFREWWVDVDQGANGLQTYRSTWNQFREWMDDAGHDHLTDLSPVFPQRYDN